MRTLLFVLPDSDPQYHLHMHSFLSACILLADGNDACIDTRVIMRMQEHGDRRSGARLELYTMQLDVYLLPL